MSGPSNRYSLKDFPLLTLALPGGKKNSVNSEKGKQAAIVAVAKEKLAAYDEHGPTVASTQGLSRDDLRKKVINPKSCSSAADLLHIIDEVAAEVLRDQPEVVMVRDAPRAFLRGYYFFHNQKSAFPTYNRLTNAIELSALSMLRSFEKLCAVIREKAPEEVFKEKALFASFRKKQNDYYRRLQKWANADRKRDQGLRARLRLQSGQVRHARYTEQEHLLYRTLIDPTFNLPTEPNPDLLKQHFSALNVGLRKETPDLRDAIPIIQELRSSLAYLNRDTPARVQLIQKTLNNKLLEETFTIRGLEQPKEQRLILLFLLNELKRVESDKQRAITESWIEESGEELHALPIEELPTVLRQLLSKVQQVTIDRSHEIADRLKEDNGIDHLDALPTLRASFLRKLDRKEISIVNTEQWLDVVMHSGASLGLTKKRRQSPRATDHILASAYIGLIKQPRSLEPHQVPETLRIGHHDFRTLQGRFQVMVREAVILTSLPTLLERYRLELPQKLLRDVRIDLHNRFNRPMEAEEAARLAMDLVEKALFASSQPITQEQRERIERDLRTRLYVESTDFRRHSNSIGRCWHRLLYGQEVTLPEKLQIMETRLKQFVEGGRKLMRINLAIHRPFYEQLTNKQAPTHPISLIRESKPLEEGDLPTHLKPHLDELVEIQASLKKAALIAHGVTLIKQALFYREAPNGEIAYITTGTPAATSQMSDEKLLSLLAHFDDETTLILDGALGRVLSPQEQAIVDLPVGEKAARLQKKVEAYREGARYSKERTAKMLSDGTLQDLVGRPDTMVIWPKECPLVPDTKPYEATNASSSDGMYHATIQELPADVSSKLQHPDYLERLLNEEGVVLHWHSSKQLSEEQVRELIRENSLSHLVSNPEVGLGEVRSTLLNLAREQGLSEEQLEKIREWLNPSEGSTQLHAFHSQLVTMLWHAASCDKPIADATHLAVLHELRTQIELLGERVRGVMDAAGNLAGADEALPGIGMEEK